MEFQVTLNGTAMPMLVLWRLAAKDKDELFAAVYQELLQRRWVHPTYLDAVKQREQEYPTGLDFGAFAVALPHIDIEHVIHSALVLVLMENPIIFQAMDDPSVSLACQLAIFPVLAATGDQLVFLSVVTTALQQQEFYATMIAQKSPEDAAAVINDAFARYILEV